ncbi:type II secretion protein F [Kineococcus sp. DHX-1]|uniref:type II secretion protein F n=1 Tax=Kineococcus sp. DHX-1 TaxID=3349638 RepID=UPI0036D3E09E
MSGSVGGVVTASPLLVAGLLLAAGLLGPGRRATRPGSPRRRRRRHGGRTTGGARAAAPAPELQAAARAEQVAALLRAGVAPATAWALLDAAPAGSAPSPGVVPGERVVHVVRRLVATTGAPAAEALDACAAGLRADAAARAAVRTALAGARTSARTVSALPLLGVVLGALLGARPWEVLATSPAGRASAVAGLVLLVAGHRWSARLVRRAAAAGR